MGGWVGRDGNWDGKGGGKYHGATGQGRDHHANERPMPAGKLASGTEQSNERQRLGLDSMTNQHCHGDTCGSRLKQPIPQPTLKMKGHQALEHREISGAWV